MLQVFSKALARSIRQTKRPGLLCWFNRPSNHIHRHPLEHLIAINDRHFDIVVGDLVAQNLQFNLTLNQRRFRLTDRAEKPINLFVSDFSALRR